jgi:hypothetical protein
MLPLRGYMFDAFKEDIAVGDSIKLHLTNTNEKPEGTVLEIGENYVLLEKTDGIKSRFFDKLIGGWDLIKAAPERGPTKIPIPQNPANKAPIITPFPKQITVNSLSAQIEKEIFTLMKEGKNAEAMQKINGSLKKSNIEDKYKSSFLLKKAQLYSTLREFDNSENAYKELILFNEKSTELRINTAALSHYCTELARLQAQKPEKISLALGTVKKAIRYNSRNTYAINLLQKLENRTPIVRPAGEADYEEKNYEGDLSVEAEDNLNDISLMLETDFKEHKYTHPLIIKNGGVPTPDIADSIAKKAKKEPYDLGKLYLIYLDAAKAYSELAPGSYDSQNYFKAAAAYAHFKGDLLYDKFKSEVLGSNVVLDELVRMKDSACSYYLESTNLLSTISPYSSQIKYCLNRTSSESTQQTESL